MLPYWILFVAISLNTLLESGKRQTYAFFIFCVILTAFIGFRHEIGGDWVAYLEIYEHLGALDPIGAASVIDPAYGILNWSSNQLGLGIYFVNFISAVIICLGIYRFGLKTGYPWVSTLILFPYLITVVAMGYTRQASAIGVLMLGYGYPKAEITRFRNFVYVVFASMFHKSAVLMLLLVPFQKSSHRVTVAYALYSFAVVMTGFAVYIYIASSVGGIYVEGEMESSGVYFRLMSHVIPIFLFLYLLWRKRGEFINARILLALFWMTLAVMFLAFVYSTLGDRLNLYLFIFDVLSVTAFLNYCSIRLRLLISFILVMQCAITYYLWFAYSSYANEFWVPYNNLLF